jgi:hypothetical protein
MSGKVRITIDVEINEKLMEMAKEGMANMPKMIETMTKKKESE